MPIENFQLEEYFCALPQLPKPVPNVFSSFVLRVEIPINDPPSKLKFAFGTAPIKSEKPSFMLDLDLFASDQDAPQLDQATEWIEKGHGHVENSFFASFTEKTHKEIFQRR